MNEISIKLGRMIIYLLPVVLFSAASGLLKAGGWPILSSLCTWAAGCWMGYVLGKGWL